MRKSEHYIAQMVSPVIQEEEADEKEEGEERRKAPEAMAKRPRFRFLSKASASHRPSRSSLSKLCVRQEMHKFKE